MANSEMLTDFVDESALRQIDRLTKNVRVLVADMQSATTQAKEFSTAMTGNQSFADFVQNLQKVAAANRSMSDTVVTATGDLKSLIEAQKLLIIEQNKRIAIAKEETEVARKQSIIDREASKAKLDLARTNKELTQTEIIIEKRAEAMEKKAKKEAAATSQLTSEYMQLNAQYKEAAKLAQNLAAQDHRLRGELGEMGRNGASESVKLAKQQEITDLSSGLKLAQDNAMKLHTSLLSIDMAVGKSQRNVGNYNEAARSLRDIIRDAPSFANSISTGIMAWSNNLPMFFDGIAKMKAANKELVANGEKPVSIMKELGTELFSVNGLLTLGVTAITIFAARMSMGGERVKKTTDIVEKYNESLKSIEENTYQAAAGEVARMQILTSVASDLSQSMKTRLDAVQALRDEFPKYFGDLEKEAILNGNIKNEIQGATEAIMKKAAALAAEQKFSEAAKKDYEIRLQQLSAMKELERQIAIHRKYNTEQEINDYLAKVAAGKDRTDAEGDDPLFGLGDAADALNKIVQLRNESRKEMTALLNDAKNLAKEAGDAMFKDGKGDVLPGTIAALQKQIETLTKQRDTVTNITTDEGKKKVRDLTIDILKLQATIDRLQGKDDHGGKSGAKSDNKRTYDGEKELQDAIFNLAKQRILQENELLKSAMDDVNASIEYRLTAYQHYYDNLHALSEKDKDRAIAIERAKVAEIESNIALNGKPNGTRMSGAELAAAKTSIAAANTQILALEEKFQAERVKLEEAGARQLVKIQKDEAQKRVDAIKFITTNNEMLEQEELQALVQQLDRKEITYKQYLRQKETLQRVSAKKTSDEVVAYLEEEIAALEKMGIDVKTLVAALDDYKVKAAKTAIGETENKNSRRKNPILEAMGLDEEQWGAVQQIGQEAIQLVDEVVKAIDARYQREIDRIQEVKSAREAAAAADIAVVNKSFMNQKQKDEKIGEIQGKLAYEKKVLDREERELKRKMAVADKAASVTKIIEGTAVAIINAQAIPPPFGQILAGIIAAVGAVQLAQVVATPLPAYKEGIGIRGRGVHPGGLALVGEAGPEVVINAGKTRVVDTPTIMDLSRDARVIPEARLLENMHLLGKGGALGSRSEGGRFSAPTSVDGAGTADVVSALARVEGAIQRLPQTKYSQSVLGVWGKTVDVNGNRINLANRINK